MKTITLIIQFFLFTSAEGQIISIEYNQLFINNIAMDSTSSITDYSKALGQQPSRVSSLANNIYTFDSLGIYIYEDYKDHNKIIEINFDFIKNADYDFSPKQKFRGKIHLVNYSCQISRHSSYRKLKRFCKANKNTSLKTEFRDADLTYGQFSLLFEYSFLLRNIKNFTIDF